MRRRPGRPIWTLPLAPLVLTVLVIASCSDSSSPAPSSAATSSSSTSTAAVGTVGLGSPVGLATPGIPRPDTIVEPTFATDNDRQLAKAVKVFDFCSGWSSLDLIADPGTGDLDASVAWAQRQYTLLNQTNPETSILDYQTGASQAQKTPLPQAVVALLATETHAAFVYLVQLQTVASERDQGALTGGAVEREADRAFVDLVAGEYDSANHKLADFYHNHCVAVAAAS